MKENLPTPLLVAETCLQGAAKLIRDGLLGLDKKTSIGVPGCNIEDTLITKSIHDCSTILAITL